VTDSPYTPFDYGQKPLAEQQQMLCYISLAVIYRAARFQLLGDVYCRPMSPEIIAILAVAVALAGLILRQGQQLGKRVEQLDQRLTAEIASLRDGQKQLGERMARLEGMIETAFRLTPTEAA